MRAGSSQFPFVWRNPRPSIFEHKTVATASLTTFHATITTDATTADAYLQKNMTSF